MTPILELELNLAINRAKIADRFSCVSTLLLLGEKGGGKTYLSHELSEMWDAEYLFYQCDESTDNTKFLFDISLPQMIDKVSGGKVDIKDVISRGILVQVLEMSKTKKVVLTIDEIDKAPREVDTFLYDFLQNFRIKDPIHGEIQGNKNNCIVVITSNEMRGLADPILSRCHPIRVQYPDKEEMFERLKSVYGEQFMDGYLRDVVRYFEDVRKLDLIYKPTQREMMRVLGDIKVISARKTDNAPEFIINYLSSYEEDRKLIKDKGLLFKMKLPSAK